MKVMTSGSEIKAFQGSVQHFSNFKVFPGLMFIFEASQGFQDPLAILNVDSSALFICAALFIDILITSDKTMHCRVFI